MFQENEQFLVCKNNGEAEITRKKEKKGEIFIPESMPNRKFLNYKPKTPILRIACVCVYMRSTAVRVGWRNA